MKVLTALATGLALSSAFAESLIATNRSLAATDLSLAKDCKNRTSRNSAVKRLQEQGVKATSNGVKAMCKKISKAHASGTRGAVEGPNKVQRFQEHIKHNPASCFGQGLNTSTQKFAIPRTLAIKLCDELQQHALNEVELLRTQGVDQATYDDESLLWWQIVEQIFRANKIRRNPYISGLRKRFQRAEKPGITPTAPAPHELFNPDVNGGVWFCHIYEPFSGTSLSRNDSSIFQAIQFSVSAYRTQDDGGYTYDYQNGMEFSGSSGGSDEVLRSIRLEYFCDKQYDDAGNRITCAEENSSSRQLLIEESQSINNFWNLFKNLFVVGDLSVSNDEAIQTFLASKASRSLGDYIQENKAKCSSYIQDCEVASRYLECTENFGEISKIITKVNAAKARTSTP